MWLPNIQRSVESHKTTTTLWSRSQARPLFVPYFSVIFAAGVVVAAYIIFHHINSYYVVFAALSNCLLEQKKKTHYLRFLCDLANDIMPLPIANWGQQERCHRWIATRDVAGVSRSTQRISARSTTRQPGVSSSLRPVAVDGRTASLRFPRFGNCLCATNARQ